MEAALRALADESRRTMLETMARGPCTVSELAALMPIADRAKGAIPIRVKLSVPREEEGVYLKPEMGAVVTFYAAETPAKTAPAAKSAEPPK